MPCGGVFVSCELDGPHVGQQSAFPELPLLVCYCPSLQPSAILLLPGVRLVGLEEWC